LLIEAAIDGGGGNGVFAATINANEGMVAGASIAAEQLTTTIVATSPAAFPLAMG
jgi:hypothetical protein